MKTPYLPIIVVASALSLASVNAMPDLGRETGKFIRQDEPAPKDVRTFTPGKEAKSDASRRAGFAFGMPTTPVRSVLGASAGFAFGMPTTPVQSVLGTSASLAFGMPTFPPQVIV